MVHAIFIGRDFIGNDSCCLILGDNIFYGTDLVKKLQQAVAQESGATVFAYPVNDPQRYGVVELSQNNEVLSLEEKPDKPKFRYAVTRIYFYDNRVLDVASSLKPSLRGELEITDINQHYLNIGQLKVIRMGRGTAWFDTGTYESLIDAAEFIQMMEKRQGFKICCPEEIAFRMGFISSDELHFLANELMKNGYGHYLKMLLHES